MIRRFLFQSLIFCILAELMSCKTNKLENKTYEISRIAFASGGCYGACPLLAIEIDSSLNYKFYGGRYSDMPGYYVGKISQELWDSINTKFEKVDFKHLDTSYQFSVDDLATQTIIFYSNTRKIVNAQSASLPGAVDSLLTWLMYSYRKVKLVESKDSLTFYSTMQYPKFPAPMFKFVTPKVGH
jgi:hypothetical protein